MTTPRNRAIRLAAKATLGFALIHKALGEAATMADDAEEGGLADEIGSLAADVNAAHAKANTLAANVASYFGDENDVGLYSGGDDKPSDPPPG